MSSSLKAACLLSALLVGASQNAYSTACFQIVDRDNSTIYSGTEPPFHMAGQEFNDGQQHLRATGRHLVWFDTPTCPLQSGRPVSIIMGPGDTVARTSATAPAARTSAAPARRTGAARSNSGTRPPRADRS